MYLHTLCMRSKASIEGTRVGRYKCQGQTGICIFEGIMDKHLYIEILDNTLKPFIQAAYPDGHQFIADNYPKHTS